MGCIFSGLSCLRCIVSGPFLRFSVEAGHFQDSFQTLSLRGTLSRLFPNSFAGGGLFPDSVWTLSLGVVSFRTLSRPFPDSFTGGGLFPDSFRTLSPGVDSFRTLSKLFRWGGLCLDSFRTLSRLLSDRLADA